MNDIKQDLPMSMTMAAFTGISWYIGLEINTSLFLLFKRRRGLYFWSCALSSWGVILQPLFIILADFGVWKSAVPSITMIYLTWLVMVVPQSWVLYSRLHLLLRNARMLKAIKIVLIFNSVAFSIPTVVIGILAQSTTINTHLISFNLEWDRLQLVVFFFQETALSIIYIFRTRKYLLDCSPLHERSWSDSSAVRGGSQIQSPEQKRVLYQLIYTNLLIIALDIALLGIQCAGLFFLQGAFKPCVYGIKLKVEFVILNRLIDGIQSRGNGGVHGRAELNDSVTPWAESPGDSVGRHTSHNGYSRREPDMKSSGDNVGTHLEHWNGSGLGPQNGESSTPILEV